MTTAKAELLRIKGEARSEGQREERMRSVQELCDVLDVELTPERRAQVQAADMEALEALRQNLKRTRAWPDIT